MDLSEERAKLMMLSMGRAVMDLSAASERVTNKNLRSTAGIVVFYQISLSTLMLST